MPSIPAKAPPILPPENGSGAERRSLKPLWLWGLAGLFILACGLILFEFNPTEYAFYPQCAFHRFTGLECPGCGSTRAVHALLHGHILSALRLNAMLVGLLPLGAWFALRFFIQQFTGKVLPHPFRHPRWGVALAAGVLLFWILRNLPLINM